MKQLLLAVTISLSLGLVLSKVPDAEIRINGNLYHGSYGNFGSRSSFDDLFLQKPPSDDPLLCKNLTSFARYTSNDIVLVPRGSCSFESKMVRAYDLGAVGVIIYNTLESRYDENDTSVIYPVKEMDYECDNGQVQIEDLPFEFDPPAYNGTIMNSYMEMDTENTLPQFASSSDGCDSRRWVFTHQTSDRLYNACCAWDNHVSMSYDHKLLNVDTSHMVAIFITMEQSEDFKSLLVLEHTASIQARPYPRFNASSFLIWMLATFVVGFASWFSGKEYRSTNDHLSNPTNSRRREVELPNRTVAPAPVPEVRVEEENDADQTNHYEEEIIVPLEGSTATMETTNTTIPTSDEAARNRISGNNINLSSLESDVPTPQQVDPLEPVIMTMVESSADPEAPLRVSDEISESFASPESQQSHNNNAAAQTQQESTIPTTRTRPRPPPNDSLTLGMWHAFFFVLFASLMLLLLFYFEFYTAIAVLYGIGCAGSIATLIFRPIYSRLPSSCAGKINLQTCLQTSLCPTITACGFHEIKLLDVISALSAYALCVLWLVVRFTSTDPSSNPYYWIMQDVMGSCISILFLSLFRLNSMKVATVLLVAVFLYDIFFVFLTPYFFNGESVMISVATSGGPEETDPDLCEKYPDNYSACHQGQPLPMLLAIPRIGDYRGGLSLLGLGDIVLPGLLISFAARLDEAKQLVGNQTNMRVGPLPRGGYLLWLILAYAIGLFCANIAVVLMKRGQPALLYIVPSILSTMIVVGWKEFRELWRGPRVLTWADRLVYYSHTGAPHHNFEDDATVAESTDDDDDDVNDEPVVEHNTNTATMVRGLNENESTREFT